MAQTGWLTIFSSLIRRKQKLLFICPNKTSLKQVVQNANANSVTLVLHQLHFKLLVLTFRALHEQASAYIMLFAFKRSRWGASWSHLEYLLQYSMLTSHLLTLFAICGCKECAKQIYQSVCSLNSRLGVKVTLMRDVSLNTNSKKLAAH